MKKTLILVFALFIFVLVGCSNKNTTATNVVTTTDSSITTTKMGETTNMTTTVDDNKFVFDEEEYMKGFNERRQYLIDYYNQYHVNIADGKVGFGMNAVRMLTYFETQNETYLTQASNNVDGCLRTCENNQNSCFFPYQFMTYYILFKDYLTEVKAKIEPKKFKEFIRNIKLLTSKSEIAPNKESIVESMKKLFGKEHLDLFLRFEKIIGAGK